MQWMPQSRCWYRPLTCESNAVFSCTVRGSSVARSAHWTLPRHTHNKRTALNVYLAELCVTTFVVEEDMDVPHNDVWHWRLAVEGPESDDLRGVVVQVVRAHLDAHLPDASELGSFPAEAGELAGVCVCGHRGQPRDAAPTR